MGKKNGVELRHMSEVKMTRLRKGVAVRSKGEERIKLDSYVYNFVSLTENYI